MVDEMTEMTLSRMGGGQGIVMAGSVSCESRQHELTEQIRARHAADFDEGVGRDQAYSFVGLGVVDIRQAAGGEVPKNMGKIEFIVAVIATADEGRLDGVESARAGAAGAFIEVARVLVKQRGKDGAADHPAAHVVGVLGAEALAEAAEAGAVSGVHVLVFLGASHRGSADKGDGIDLRTKGEGKFLARIERRRVPVVCRVEVGDDAEDALALLDVHFRFRDLHLGVLAGGDVHCGHAGGERKHHIGHKVRFAGMQHNHRRFKRAHAGPGDLDPVVSWRQSGEGELPVWPGVKGALAHRPDQDHVRALQHVTIGIQDGAGDRRRIGGLSGASGGVLRGDGRGIESGRVGPAFWGELGGQRRGPAGKEEGEHGAAGQYQPQTI